jgi:hypothetical protein
MAVAYDLDLIHRLQDVIREQNLLSTHAPTRYEPGHVFDVEIRGVHPAVTGRAKVEALQFIGGGFAGQVYRSRVVELDLGGETIPGLDVGGIVNVKIMIPPSRGKKAFRDLLYAVGYQGSFSMQVDENAVRTGALWQKLIRRGAKLRFGDERSVRDCYATFFDDEIGSYGEIGEWVEGRMWKLEIDDDVTRRADRAPDDPRSAEYRAKKQFMHAFVDLIHAMGNPELARQYEWWSLKSQPNVMKRFDCGDGPGDGLCALDFRAGLALLAFLPMSPVDVRLCLRGLRQGKFVQFDRGDLEQLEAFCDEHAEEFADLRPALDELKRVDPAYRASLPGNHGVWKLLANAEARQAVRDGLTQGWSVRRLVDDEHAPTLRRSTTASLLFFVAGLVPFIGSALRRYWGHAPSRRHFVSFFTSFAYCLRTFRARAAETLIDWHRIGQVSRRRAEFYLRNPAAFVCVRVFPGILPLPPGLHRAVTDWGYAFNSVWDWVRFAVHFYRNAEFRREWLTGEIIDGAAHGMLTDEERDHLLERTDDPYIQKYLKCLAVHVCTLPITQVISVMMAVWAYFYFGTTWKEGVAWGLGVLAAFQVTPWSPGSVCRGTYVVYLMIRERNWRQYWLAAAISYWHYVGYVGFPVQMVREFPTLSRFMAGRWAIKMSNVVPVFGEKGGLFEHFVFDLFFNTPITLRRSWESGRLSAGARWNVPAAAVSILVSVGLQWLCFAGGDRVDQALLAFGLMVGVLAGLRSLVGVLTDERGRGWLFYSVLLLLSPIGLFLFGYFLTKL